MKILRKTLNLAFVKSLADSAGVLSMRLKQTLDAQDRYTFYKKHRCLSRDIKKNLLEKAEKSFDEINIKYMNSYISIAHSDREKVKHALHAMQFIIVNIRQTPTITPGERVVFENMLYDERARIESIVK